MKLSFYYLSILIMNLKKDKKLLHLEYYMNYSVDLLYQIQAQEQKNIVSNHNIFQ